MRNLLGCCLFLIVTLLVAGCAGVEKETPLSTAKINIEPYNMSENERLLISTTDINHIEFFKLEGELKADDDLQFAVDVYEKGKLKEKLLTTSDELNPTEDGIISFGITNDNADDQSLKLISGTLSGLSTTNLPIT